MCPTVYWYSTQSVFVIFLTNPEFVKIGNEIERVSKYVLLLTSVLDDN